MFHVACNRRHLSITVAGLIGALLFFWLYGELLRPTYIEWILTTGGDPFQHYIGWEFFRAAPWSWPLGLNQYYGYPIGVPVSYTDSLPLLAIPFKLFSRWLPSSFQYLGIWMFICFVLQGVFSFLLLHVFTKRKLVSLLGTVFFILSPVLLLRLGGHTALGSHWLILAALYITVRPHERLQTWSWLTLFLLSILIHPYLFIVIGFVMLADVARLLLVAKKVSFQQVCIFLAIQIVSVLALAYSLGLFYIGESAVDEYGQYSMNLNALWSPLGWGQLLPDQPTYSVYQNEGLNYLGAGVLLLLLVSFVYFLLWQKDKKNIGKDQWPLLVVVVVLSLIAITNFVTWGDQRWVLFALPDWLRVDLLGIVRASGRMFWPVYYLLMVLSFFIVTKKKFVVSLLVVLLALTIQLYDLWPRLRHLDENYENRVYQTYLPSPFWSVAATEYDHISFIPDFAFGVYEPIALYAAQNQMTLNVGYFARPILGKGEHIQKQVDELKAGIVQDDTLYIFPKKIRTYVENIDLTKHLLLEVDYYYVLTPNGRSLNFLSPDTRELSLDKLVE